MTTKQEDFTNRKLALLLQAQGLSADYEERQGRRRMDVVADVEGLRVVLEAETGFHRKAQAVKDADARLRQKLTTAVFAVCYPVGVTEDTLVDSELTWTLRVKLGEPVGDWSTGSVAQLAQAVRQVPGSLSGADVAAQILSDGLDVAVQRLTSPARQALARALDLPPTKPGKGAQVDAYLVAAKRGMLVVATAMLFHHRLQGHLSSESPEGYAGVWPPFGATICAEQAAPISAFMEAWRGILAVDYRPVFETGRTALAALPSDPDTDTGQAVSGLAGVVAHVAERVTGLRHDLLGRIFHRVLDTARYDGSYYTSTAAAVLLASVAIREEDSDWGDPKAVAALRICDPACGTGTLLMAAAERIRDLRNRRGLLAPDDEEALGLSLVEDVLWGYDVNLTATHMAASTLGMLSPSTRFHRMNVHRALLGVFNDSPYLGSLDFLSGQARLRGWPSATQQVESGEAVALPPLMDLVIMNPPFTRDSLRHDQFSREDELAIKQREKAVMENLPDRGAARLSGSANAFMVLGERMVRAVDGTLAVVLPTVMATNPAAFHTRRYLAQRFHIDTIVSSHDPGRIYFSENTSIGEVLIICRRWKGTAPKPQTRVVNLARNPATPLDATSVADRIDRVGDIEEPAAPDFTVQQVDADRIGRGDWFAVNFLSPFLVEAYRTLTETDQASVPTVRLDGLADVGPEGRRIRDSYTRSDLPTPSGRRALWHHKTDVTQSMAAEADSYIEPNPAKRHLADRYWEQGSRLLLPHRLWLPLARIAAAMLPERVVGSMWTPCRAHDPRIEQALCLYLNSSPGVLALLGGRDNRKPSYPSFSLDTLRSLRLPDLTRLGDAELQQLDDAYERLRAEILQPLPKMADDPVRSQIDDAVSQTLGFDAGWIRTVRRELAREPSVTDKPYGL